MKIPLTFIGKPPLTEIEDRRAVWRDGRQDDGNPLYGVAVGVVMTLGFLGMLWLVYQLALWIKP